MNNGNHKKHAKRIDRSTLNSVERDLIDGLEGFLGDLKSDAPIEKKYTCRRIVLELELRQHTSEQIKNTRKQLNASQALFAQFLGVSVKTVRAWEQGKTLSDMACRFIDEIDRNPEYWRRRLKESIKIRTADR